MWTIVEFEVCERSGQLPWECGLAACENGCATKTVAFVPLTTHTEAVEALGEIHAVLGAGAWDIYPEVRRAVEIARPYAEGVHGNRVQVVSLDDPKMVNVLARVIENRHGTLHGIGDTLREALAEIKREGER